MIALRAARLFDGMNLLDDRTVVIEGERILEVRADPPAGAELIELGDATLLPGLIDTHTHLCFNASNDPVGHLEGLLNETLLDEMRIAARTVLRSGVTTIRDLGDRDYLSLTVRAETAADPLAGPTVLAAGPPITTTGGHCWFLGGVADGVDAIRAAVRERAERGVDVIKVMASGGGMTPGSALHVPQYSRAELAVAVDEAHRLGLPVAAHAHAVTAIADAVAVGCDTIEHCSFATEDGVAHDEAVIAELAATGIAVSLTVGVVPGGPPPPEEVRKRIAGFVKGLHAMRDAGVTMVCGSDNGMLAQKPHDSYGYSVGDMVALAGLAPVDALRSATSVAARVCRIADRKGSIAAGMDADIIAVAGDPLTEIAAVRNVISIFRRGMRVSHS